MNFAMYFAFTDTVLKHGWEHAADTAQNYGCSSVEILESTIPSSFGLFSCIDDALNARNILKSRNLDTACFSVYTNLYKEPENVKFLKCCAEYAAALGSPFLHHTVLPWIKQDDTAPDFDEAIEIATDAAEEVANYASKLGITCIYEDQGFYANGIEGYGAFYNEMKRRCDNVAVCGDMGNSLFADLPGEEFFKAYANDIVHVHVKDYHKKISETCPGDKWYKTKNGAWLHDSFVGEGIVDIEACMKILKDVGYNGTIAIESSDIAESIAYLKKFPL